MKKKKSLNFSSMIEEEEKNIFCMQHSRLKNIPNFDCNITKLDVRRNEIKEMDFPYSETLIYVDLSDNQIKKIKNLEKIPNLKFLDLSYNLITKMKFPETKIEELYLICNDLTKIDKINLQNVKIIDLAVNEICKIENLESCLQLRELYLGNNKIENIPDLNYLSNLEILDLQSNKITQIDCSLLPTSIKQLLLSDNKNLKKIINYGRLTNLSLLAVERTLVEPISLNIEIWK
jgi:protein phosphatase 1 regulatory subunit 7